MRRAARALGLDAARAAAARAPRAGRDELLDLIVGARVGPALGANALTFLHRYPASQAALARLDPDDPRVALRFELYHRGIELANGYHELASGAEQRARFAADLESRAARGLPVARDRRQSARGARRRAARLRGSRARLRSRAHARVRRDASIDEVLAFPTERA